MDISTLVILMGVAAWAGVIAWAVHSYRRKQEDRERERSMRYEQMFGAALAGTQGAAGADAAAGAPAASPAATAGAGSAAAGTGVAGLAASGIDPARLAAAFMASQGTASGRATAVATGAAALMPEAPILPVPGYRLRERVLDKTATLAYYAVRTAMPDHEVFVGLSLADLLDVPDSVRGYDRELRLRKLSPLSVDFAIATKGMQLVAVIDLEDATMTAEQRDAQRLKAEYLRPFPVRHLTFPRSRLPKYQEIRQLLQAAG